MNMEPETPKKPEKLEFKPSTELIKKRKEFKAFKSDVEQLREDIKKKREIRLRKKAHEQVCYWMDTVVLPFLQGIAESFNEPLLEGVKRLIREKKNPFRPKQDWNRTKETEFVLTKFLGSPQTKLLQIVAKPFLKAKLDWINKEASWVREEVLKEEYPQLYDAIMETDGGQEWLDNLLTDLTKRLRGITR